MQRTISTETHAAIDSAWATVASALPGQMHGATATARLVRNAGMAASLNSSLTNYEAGVLRIMPMRGHLACDLVIGSVLIASPFFLPRSERRWAVIPVALGVVGLLTSLMTQTRSPLEDPQITTRRGTEAARLAD
jgi:hypothetical protein